DFARCRVDHVGCGNGTIQLSGFDFDFGNLVRTECLKNRRRNLAARVRNLFALDDDCMCRLRAQQMRRLLGILIERPEELAILHRNLVDGVEGLEDLLVRLETESAQKDGAQELALAVNANVEGVLLVVLKLNPRTAVGNDLAKKIGAVVRRLKEDAGRTV